MNVLRDNLKLKKNNMLRNYTFYWGALITFLSTWK